MSKYNVIHYQYAVQDLKRVQTPFLPDDVTDDLFAYSGHERRETFQIELNFWISVRSNRCA